MSFRVGIAGVSGYTGIELVRVLAAHPAVAITWLGAGKAAGEPLSATWPGVDLGLPVGPVDATAIAAACDLVFLALPHGVSAPVARDCLAAGVRVVDLGADFRLKDPAAYAAAYGAPHPTPALLATAVYGLPEKHRAAIAGARLVANPGCYPTATALAALPLVEDGLVDWLVADCISGISGAGRSPGPRNLYCEVQESVGAYSPAGAHRHTPEIEQELGVPVTFTPHLAPLRRGMTATVSARLRPGHGLDTAALRARYAARYAGHPMVRVVDTPPASREVRGTALARVCPVVDVARGVVTVMSAIDNLGRGASTQAVHNMNLMLGLPEATGLPTLPEYP